MRAEQATAGPPVPLAIHASAVAIDGLALLICGPSRSGKSRLAVTLVARSTRRRPIRLLGDDRILLAATPGALLARPHPRIAGFIERRGLGIVAMRHVAEAPLAAVVVLPPTTMPPTTLENFPLLSLVDGIDSPSRCARVLEWWTEEVTATSRQHLHENDRPLGTCA